MLWKYAVEISQTLDLSHLITALVVLCALAIAQTLVGLFLKSLLRQHLLIKCLATVMRPWPIPPPIYGGRWKFNWTVDSDYPPNNPARGRLYKFRRHFTAQFESKNINGHPRNYVFVGKLEGSAISGRWFDKSDRDAGYHGMFQVLIQAGEPEAKGKWLGFSRSETVKTGDLVWKKV